MTAKDINCFVIEQKWPEGRIDHIIGYTTRMDIQTYFNKETGHEGEGLTHTNKSGYQFSIMTLEQYCNTYEGVGTYEENIKDALFDMDDPELIDFLLSDECPEPFRREDE